MELEKINVSEEEQQNSETEKKTSETTKKISEEERQAAKQQAKEARKTLRQERREEKASANYKNKKNAVLSICAAVLFGITALINLFKGLFPYAFMFGIIALANVVFGIKYYRDWKGGEY